MKKFVKVLLILAACLACLGVVLTAVGGFWSARVYNRLIPEEAVSISFPLNADTLSSLTLNVGVGEVRFAEAPSPEAARMDTEGFSEGDFTFSENRQGEVVLRSRSMLGGESIFNLGFLRMDWLGRLHTGTLARRIVTVYLPAGQLDRLRIEGGTGDIGGCPSLLANFPSPAARATSNSAAFAPMIFLLKREWGTSRWISLSAKS